MVDKLLVRPFTDPSTADYLAAALMDAVSARCNPWTHVPAFMFVGAPDKLADSVGPRVGSELRKHGFAGLATGHMKFPIGAWDVDHEAAWLTWKAGTMNRKPFIIAVDAAVSNKPGNVCLCDGPLEPWAGLRGHEHLVRCQPPPRRKVGDLHILAGMMSHPAEMHSVPEEMVNAAVYVIREAILSFWQAWEEYVTTEAELAAAAAREPED